MDTVLVTGHCLSLYTFKDSITKWEPLISPQIFHSDISQIVTFPIGWVVVYLLWMGSLEVMEFNSNYLINHHKSMILLYLISITRWPLESLPSFRAQSLTRVNSGAIHINARKNSSLPYDDTFAYLPVPPVIYYSHTSSPHSPEPLKVCNVLRAGNVGGLGLGRI